MANRHLAHRHIFAHRHKESTPEFHEDILNLLYSPDKNVALQAFRGAAKSTLIEEFVILSVLFQEKRFPIIVGNSYERACERLTAIKNEIANNDIINELFGDQMGGTWSENIIVLACGARIQAFGARQSLRGAKYLDQRPDMAVVDDLEDEEMVGTEEARQKLKRWFNGALRPALDITKACIRMVGTPLHPKALLEEKMSDSAWTARRFPILMIDEDGHEQSTWESRFSLTVVQALKQEYINDGNLVEFEQEYMCRSEDIAAKPFKPEMIRVEPAPVVWVPTFMMVDPARTVKKKSARTGYAVWAWAGRRLYVHEAEGHFDRPDEIIARIFEWDEKYNPVLVGVEENGLEEFIMQPLRQEQVKRGHSIPLEPLRAPRDKDGFIRGLQPFYMAGEVVHAKHMQDLVSELLQFPTGRKDVPNALAYALKMRAGRAVYEDFSANNMVPELERQPRQKSFLVMSSRPAMTTGILAQYHDGVVRVYESWVYDEPPLEAVEKIMQEVRLCGVGRVEVVAPAEQFERYTGVGLPQAVKRMGVVAMKTKEAARSEGSLAPWLRKQVRGESAFQVDPRCRWVVNALAGGYARKLGKQGDLADRTVDNKYKVLIEALESFVSWFDVLSTTDNNDMTQNVYYATTADGRKYISALPEHRR
jgi:hypothetical protein